MEDGVQTEKVPYTCIRRPIKREWGKENIKRDFTECENFPELKKGITGFRRDSEFHAGEIKVHLRETAGHQRQSEDFKSNQKEVTDYLHRNHRTRSQ